MVFFFISEPNCAEILVHGPSSEDGVYVINPLDGEGFVRVYCDMTTDGGGWTVCTNANDNPNSTTNNTYADAKADSCCVDANSQTYPNALY